MYEAALSISADVGPGGALSSSKVMLPGVVTAMPMSSAAAPYLTISRPGTLPLTNSAFPSSSGTMAWGRPSLIEDGRYTALFFRPSSSRRAAVFSIPVLSSIWLASGEM
jgi:hypothetical protein